MAHVYVDYNAAGAGTGADWANAYITLAAALTAKAAGDNFWVAQDHAESTAGAVTLTSPGTAAAPCTIICVNKAGTVPPVAADLATTATITTTAANALVFGAGHSYVYGIAFNSGSGATTTALQMNVAGLWHLQSCALKKNGTTANTGALYLGINGGRIILDNVQLGFGATGDGVSLQGGHIIWRNRADPAVIGSIPTTLFRVATVNTDLLVEGVDLSAIASQTLVGAVSSNGRIRFKDCKLPALASPKVTRQTSVARPRVELIRCASSDVNYTQEIAGAFEGDLTTEITIVRTGGASDGTTPISWKIVASADAKWLEPFECFPITIWNETVGAVTVSVYGYHNDAAVPNNDQIWMDVEYLGTSGFPLGNFATTNKASYLAAAAGITEDTTSTWGGGDTTTRFVLSKAITVAEKGPITIYVKVAKASATIYIDPKAVLS